MILADGAVWTAWTSVTPVHVRAATTSLVRVRIPQTIAPGEDGAYASLRVVDERDREIPYALDPAPRTSPERVVPLIDSGFVAGRGTQAVVDLGTRGELENAITLEIDASALPTFFEPVNVEASDDRTVWRIVRTDALIYRVAQDSGNGNLRITFPATRSRWLRIRIVSAHAAFPLVGASVANTTATSPELDEYARLQWHETSANHIQTWIARSDVAVRPAAVLFRTHRGDAFSRPAVVAVSGDGTTWDDIGSETIANYDDGTKHLAFTLDATTANALRVIVRDGNDGPIDVTPAVFGVRHAVVFEAESGSSYRFLAGNSDAAAPTYDLADRLEHRTWRTNDDTSTGLTIVAAPLDRRSFSQRYPWILTAAIVGIAIALAALAFATIRSANEATE